MSSPTMPSKRPISYLDLSHMSSLTIPSKRPKAKKKFISRFIPVQTDEASRLSSQQLPSASDYGVNTSHNVYKHLKSVWSEMETVLRLLENTADGCPPLKTAVSGLVACLDLEQAIVENHEAYVKLATDLKDTAEILIPYVPELIADGVSGSLARIMKSIEEESREMTQQREQGMMSRILGLDQDQEAVLQQYYRVGSLFRQMHSNISLQNWEGTKKLVEKTLLDPVDDARYNSSYSATVYRGGCTADTRQKILNNLKAWVVDPNGAKIYWMNGMAGTGKTTISYTLCEWLEKKKQLGANYFCSHTSPPCRNASNIVPSLAYQLAQYFPGFGSRLCDILQKNPETSRLAVKFQFEKLLQEPIQEVRASMPKNVVIVIDALDECDNSQAFKQFLDTLLKLASDIPIKFFITSRPEPLIHKRMLAPGYSHSMLYLHEIEKSIVEADIQKYLTEKLGSMSPLASPNDVEQLAKQSGNLFIYAATAVRYIQPNDPDPGVDSKARLQTMLGTVPQETMQYEGLDKLYRSIISAAINPKLRQGEASNIQLILRTVVCAKEPMTIQTLASLLCLTVDQVHIALQPLQSILHIQEDAQTMVAPFHASFPDFLFDKLRSGEFHCDTISHNEALANYCFNLMKKQLKFNICDLESSYVFDDDVPPVSVIMMRRAWSRDHLP